MSAEKKHTGELRYFTLLSFLIVSASASEPNRLEFIQSKLLISFYLSFFELFNYISVITFLRRCGDDVVVETLAGIAIADTFFNILRVTIHREERFQERATKF